MIANILDTSLENCAGLEAILCMNPSETQEHVTDQLLDLECKVYIAKSTQDAMNKLQIHPFQIVIIESNYSMEIMQFLAYLPMVVRRNMFYVLLGETLETGNYMQSYVLSANLVFNNNDIATFGEILQNSLLEYNYFYRSYQHALQSAHKNVR